MQKFFKKPLSTVEPLLTDIYLHVHIFITDNTLGPKETRFQIISTSTQASGFSVSILKPFHRI